MQENYLNNLEVQKMPSEIANMEAASQQQNFDSEEQLAKMASK